MPFLLLEIYCDICSLYKKKKNLYNTFPTQLLSLFCSYSKQVSRKAVYIYNLHSLRLTSARISSPPLYYMYTEVTSDLYILHPFLSCHFIYNSTSHRWGVPFSWKHFHCEAFYNTTTSWVSLYPSVLGFLPLLLGLSLQDSSTNYQSFGYIILCCS